MWQACAIVQAVSGRPVTTEAWLQLQANQYGICGIQSGTGTGFSPSTSVVPSYSVPIFKLLPKEFSLHDAYLH
jgi:hypothetical protein